MAKMDNHGKIDLIVDYDKYGSPYGRIRQELMAEDKYGVFGFIQCSRHGFMPLDKNGNCPACVDGDWV